MKSCVLCNQLTEFRKSQSPLIELPQTTRPLQRIVMDIILRHPPIKYDIAETLASVFVFELILNYGVPDATISAQVTNFMAELILQVCNLFKINNVHHQDFRKEIDEQSVRGWNDKSLC
ncbi:hypothetical protein PR048_012817 [Dryococelus australis]|uniref:Uncharacterized protein n=1 Tax=Dryococelus australis TaxID=614101 RepID=A0ABQ9HQF6_9NEOP|nr:hypothetical protein PR048_012817 [Dryococelus australis]